MAVAVAVAVAVSGCGAVAVAVPVAGLTKIFFNQKDFLINVWGYLLCNFKKRISPEKTKKSFYHIQKKNLNQ